MSELSPSTPGRASRAVPGGGVEPIDLTDFGVLAHFAKRTGSIKLIQYLQMLDGLDRWAVDYDLTDGSTNEGRQFAVRAFLQSLEKVVAKHAQVFHRVPEPVAELLARLTTARSMYVLRYVAERNEAFAEKLGSLLSAETGEGSPSLAVLSKRLQALSRAQLLGEIFSGQRLTYIMQIMRSYADV